MANLLEIREMKAWFCQALDKGEVTAALFFFFLWNLRNFYFHFSVFPTFNTKNLFLFY